MKLIIDIPEEEYNSIKGIKYYVSGQRSEKTLTNICLNSIANGIPLAKGHGAIIDVKDIETIRIVDNGELTIYKLGTDVEAYIYATPLVKPDEEMNNETDH